MLSARRAGIGRGERLEEGVHAVRRDADTRVRDLELHPHRVRGVVGTAADPDVDGPFLGEVERVGHEVRHDLRDARPVADRGRRDGVVDDERDRQAPALGEGRRPLLDPRQQRAHLERPGTQRRTPCLQAGELQQVVHQLHQSLTRAVRHLDVVPLVRPHLAADEELGGADERGQRCAELVADGAEEEGLRGVGLLELAQHPLGFGDVLGDAVHADDLLVHDHRDHRGAEVHDRAVRAQHPRLEHLRDAGEGLGEPGLDQVQVVGMDDPREVRASQLLETQPGHLQGSSVGVGVVAAPVQGVRRMGVELEHRGVALLALGQAQVGPA